MHTRVHVLINALAPISSGHGLTTQVKSRDKIQLLIIIYYELEKNMIQLLFKPRGVEIGGPGALASPLFCTK